MITKHLWSLKQSRWLRSWKDSWVYVGWVTYIIVVCIKHNLRLHVQCTCMQLNHKLILMIHYVHKYNYSTYIHTHVFTCSYIHIYMLLMDKYGILSWKQTDFKLYCRYLLSCCCNWVELILSLIFIIKNKNSTKLIILINSTPLDFK